MTRAEYEELLLVRQEKIQDEMDRRRQMENAKSDREKQSGGRCSKGWIGFAGECRQRVQRAFIPNELFHLDLLQFHGVDQNRYSP
jgi:hypothetical protein